MKLYRFLLLALAMQFASSIDAQVYCGDINHDGVIDMADVTRLVNVVLGKEGKEFWKIQGDSLIAVDHDYVDLGLPSGTLWATCNIGAEKPEEAGLYFAWGETTGHTSDMSDGYASDGYSFNWDHYKYCEGSSTSMTKYCTNNVYGAIDYRASLESSDDAASVNWGSSWQMPSSEQVAELCNSEYTSSTWKQINGVNGRLFTSKINGKQLFIPAIGYRYELGITDENSGAYWIRNLRSKFTFDAYCMVFTSSYIESVEYGYHNRCSGMPVRAVKVTKDSNLLPGKFTVNAEGKQVQFTKSNLYWNGSEYKFEDRQTDYEGTWEELHVGHFYWTNITDYQSCNSYYVPFTRVFRCSAQSTTDEFFCGENNPLVVEGTDGLYALSGGTGGEWKYLLFSRNNASKLYKLEVTVTADNAVRENCVVIAPDDFKEELKSSYTLDEINDLGLVCLPAAGLRYGSNYSNLGIEGLYWSSTPNKGYQTAAWCINFINGGIDVQQYNGKDNAQSIRLVKTVLK